MTTLAVLGPVAVGALAMLLAVAAAYRIGRLVTDMVGVQLRTTVRELTQASRARGRQVAAIADGLGRLIADPRTHPHTRLELERLLDLTTTRGTS